MGRNTEIYMFDKEKASAHLYEDLKHTTFHKRTFKTYLEDRKKELSGTDFEVGFEEILNTIKNDINAITPDELFEINLFLSEEIHSKFSAEGYPVIEKHLQNLNDRFGIILLYELPTSTVCTSYMFQYGNYTHYFPIYDMPSKDGGTNLDSKDFLHFNDYIILLTKMILDNNLDGYEYTFTKDEEEIIHRITEENQNHLVLFKEVENEYEFLKNAISTDTNGPNAQTIYYAYTFFKQSLEMKSRIQTEKNPRIVILDSY